MEIDIKNKLIKDFGNDGNKAIQILEEFEAKNNLSARVSRCIVFLAQGNVEELKKSIKQAETDWRDVINYAESKDFEFNFPFQ